MDKTVIITGSSRGIGCETAKAFAKVGYNVVINYYKSRKRALTVSNEINESGGRAIAIQADVSKYGQAQKLIDESIKIFGKIDVLVNNAGIAQQKLFTDITNEEWNLMFDVNIKSMFNCTKFVVKDMIKRHSGKIINVSSIWGITGASCEVHYSASKAAVIGFTKALAKELGPSKIQVNCVAPGIIDTEMNSGLNENTLNELLTETPCGRMGTPQEVAKIILFLCSTDADFITGQVVSPNGGFLV